MDYHIYVSKKISLPDGFVPLNLIDSNSKYKYGFIVRYPKGKENITGYMYEPWHLRYVGIELAKYIYEHSITLDEYFEEKNR